MAALTAWLDQERRTTVDVFKKQGLPLIKSVRRVFAKRTYTSGNRSASLSVDKTGQDSVDVSPISVVPKYVSLKWKPSTPSPFGESHDESSVALNTFAETGILSAFAETDALSAFVQRLVGDYLSSLRSLSEPDHDLARRVINDYLDYLEASEITENEELVVGGIAPPVETLEVPDVGISVRSLTSEELGANISHMLGLDAGDDMFLLGAKMFERVPHSSTDFSLGCVVKSTCVRPKGRAIDDETRLDRIVLALQVLGYSICGRGLVIRWPSPGPRMGWPVAKVTIPELPEHEEKDLTVETIRQAAGLADLVPASFRHPKRREEVAIHQFSVGAAQESRADSLIAFTIALEAILLPGLQGENSYRFRLNGAKYLGSDAAERRLLHDNLKQIYEVRSKLVHGAPPKRGELKDLRREARDLAARCLLKALIEGWPSGAAFETLALG